MTDLQTGDKAPEFCLPDKDGETFCPDELKGGHAVLYFYPRDGRRDAPDRPRSSPPASLISKNGKRRSWA